MQNWKSIPIDCFNGHKIHFRQKKPSLIAKKILLSLKKSTKKSVKQKKNYENLLIWTRDMAKNVKNDHILFYSVCPPEIQPKSRKFDIFVPEIGWEG